VGQTSCTSLTLLSWVGHGGVEDVILVTNPTVDVKATDTYLTGNLSHGPRVTPHFLRGANTKSGENAKISSFFRERRFSETPKNERATHS
jgi:hypothetical protein